MEKCVTECPFCGALYDQESYDNFFDVDVGMLMETEAGTVLLEAGSCLCGAINCRSMPDVIE